MADFDSIISKLVSDPAFCAEIVSNPEATLRAHNLDATPEMVSALRGLDAASVQRLAAAFGAQKAAA